MIQSNDLLKCNHNNREKTRNMAVNYTVVVNYYMLRYLYVTSIWIHLELWDRKWVTSDNIWLLTEPITDYNKVKSFPDSTGDRPL